MLRGFESGKVGPKDGKDFIGGIYITELNINTTLPQIFPNLQDVDFSLFFDAANVWGVDYDSSINDSNKIRSSVGFGVDWFTVVGPITFSLTEVITKDDHDIEENFRFNLEQLLKMYKNFLIIYFTFFFFIQTLPYLMIKKLLI